MVIFYSHYTKHEHTAFVALPRVIQQSTHTTQNVTSNSRSRVHVHKREYMIMFRL